MNTYDLVVVGGGAGGLTAAREATRRGARTMLVSDGPLGGDCTHTGCVPSKALLSAASAGRSFADAMDDVRRHIDTIAATEDADVLTGEGVEVLRGRAGLTGGGGLDVDGERIDGRRIILATGSRAKVPPVPGIDTVEYLTNESVFSLVTQPQRLAILGGGPIGVELAQAFADLGTTVTLVEAAQRLLPREEPEASETIARTLGRRGVDVRVGRGVDRVTGDGDGRICLHLADDSADSAIVADELLVAAGRTPVTEGLSPDTAGVDLDERGHIRTDDTLATTASGIWAIGDVTGRMPFTHAAGRMAVVAVANALAGRARLRSAHFDPAAIPWVTFTDPEVGRVGIAEADAADRGGRVAFLPFDELDRGIVSGATDGFVKLIAGPRRLLGNAGGGKLLGATIVGPRAGEMVGEVALAMHTNMFAGRLAQATHAYPTWSMAIQEAAAQYFMTYGGRTARAARAD